MFTLKHSMEIEAPPDRVWEILMDFERYFHQLIQRHIIAGRVFSVRGFRQRSPTDWDPYRRKL